MKFPSHAAVDDYTGFLLRKVSHASFAGFSKVVETYGLHPMHFGMLTIIAAEEPVSQQELSRRTGIDPSTMVARMDALVERGYVERTRGSEDRRSYENPPQPRRAGAAGRPGRAGARLRRTLPRAAVPAERTQLHELLAKLAASIDETASS